MKEIVFYSDDYFYLSNGIKISGTKENTVRGRNVSDERLTEAYLEGIIDVVSGEEHLADVAEKDYSEIHWKTLTSDIKNGKYDDELDQIIEKDGRDSVIDATKKRKQEINSNE